VKKKKKFKFWILDTRCSPLTHSLSPCGERIKERGDKE